MLWSWMDDCACRQKVLLTVYSYRAKAQAAPGFIFLINKAHNGNHEHRLTKLKKKQRLGSTIKMKCMSERELLPMHQSLSALAES